MMAVSFCSSIEPQRIIFGGGGGKEGPDKIMPILGGGVHWENLQSEIVSSGS